MKKNHIPLVSIIVPVYNGARFLRDAIDSILGQSFTDFELILINDGSSDHSLEIMQSYTDGRIRIIDQANQGVARSLNNALHLARGKYIRRHDADDLSTTDGLLHQVRFLENNPIFSLVSGQIAYMTDRGKIAMDYRNPATNFFEGATHVNVDHEIYKRYRPVIHATVLMNREVVLKLGGYRSEFLTSEDIDLWLRFLDEHKIAVLNDCSYFVRLHSTSATQRHRGSVDHYRNLAFEYAAQRQQSGSDDLQRGLSVPVPAAAQAGADLESGEKGKIYRDDLLFYYRILVNAKDRINILKTVNVILQDGWKNISNWKMILLPWLSPGMLAKGIKVKHWIKNSIPAS